MLKTFEVVEGALSGTGGGVDGCRGTLGGLADGSEGSVDVEGLDSCPRAELEAATGRSALSVGIDDASAGVRWRIGSCLGFTSSSK